MIIIVVIIIGIIIIIIIITIIIISIIIIIIIKIRPVNIGGFTEAIRTDARIIVVISFLVAVGYCLPLFNLIRLY